MTLIITDEDVQRLLPMSECIEAMRVAFADFAEGAAVNRPRLRYLARHSDPELRYMANVHAGAVPSYGVACVRAGSQILRPPSATNDRRSYDNPGRFNWGIAILYSMETAEPLAFLHEYALSGLRVGATTGAAIDAMARPDASRLCLFGTGKQARSALAAIEAVRPLERLALFSPNAAHRAAFLRDAARPGLELVEASDARAAMQGADIVCCATSAMTPVFDGNWLTDDQIVVSIANSDVTNKRSEVDRRTFERASVVIVNDWESVVENDQTELLEPIAAGAVQRDAVIELGDLFLGKATVRQPARGAQGRGPIYYKNNSGLAIQFAASGGLLYRKAVAEGRCRELPTEWFGTDLSAAYRDGFRPSP